MPNANAKSATVLSAIEELTEKYEYFMSDDADELSAAVSALRSEAGDIILVEAHDIAILASFLSNADDDAELWLIRPRQRDMAVEMRMCCGSRDYWTAARCAELAKDIKKILGKECPCFMGFTDKVPEGGPLMQFSRNCDCLTGISEDLELYDPFWSARHSRLGSIAVCLYEWQPGGVSICFGNDPAVSVGGLDGGSHFSEAPSKILQFSNNHVLLVFDENEDSLTLVDCSSSGEEWVGEVSSLDIAVNGGCHIPSYYRGEHIGHVELQLKDLCVKIGRGTSLSAKALPGLSEPLPINKALSFHGDPKNAVLFIDSGCIKRSERLRFMALSSIPEGQERYVVHPEDGEVLLISRPDAACSVYKAQKPTLIANNVFVVRLAEDSVDATYLQCWISSNYARRLLGAAPQSPLSKSGLENLPVPLIEPEAEKATAERAESMKSEIRLLRYQISAISAMDAFSPAQAMRGKDSWKSWLFPDSDSAGSPSNS